MLIKNNSQNTYKDYDCGDEFIVTIKPGETVEVPEKAGLLLLKNLGHPNYLVEVQKEEKSKKEDESKREDEKKDVEKTFNRFKKD